jgi:hypothetical protein
MEMEDSPLNVCVYVDLSLLRFLDQNGEPVFGRLWRHSRIIKTY